jgi:hypothetical protein
VDDGFGVECGLLLTATGWWGRGSEDVESVNKRGEGNYEDGGREEEERRRAEEEVNCERR